MRLYEFLRVIYSWFETSIWGVLVLGVWEMFGLVILEVYCELSSDLYSALASG